eukprot:NODE_971_length_1964_cov_48.844106_g921_i0.p1 GENE.NODE_971_length_1964_cov_48.844106_g921_i0~~NODE_971_length_1964_cov_48.844106_g921_i0.p1  ORF type:complete len:563 (+),score=51.96 NODE_971_length_1964_cov_48.844106_g921_i0:78-1766(+)
MGGAPSSRVAPTPGGENNGPSTPRVRCFGRRAPQTHVLSPAHASPKPQPCEASSPSPQQLSVTQLSTPDLASTSSPSKVSSNLNVSNPSLNLNVSTASVDVCSPPLPSVSTTPRRSPRQTSMPTPAPLPKLMMMGPTNVTTSCCSVSSVSSLGDAVPMHSASMNTVASAPATANSSPSTTESLPEESVGHSSRGSRTDAQAGEPRPSRKYCVGSLLRNVGPERALCGLKNLGNTCFMASVLQCLLNTELLTYFFLSGTYKRHLNRTRGMKGQLAEAFGEIVLKAYSDDRPLVISPHRFKSLVSSWATGFAGHNQQDAQEFLRFLLDGLHEDVNRVRSHPAYVELKDIADESDYQTSERWWRYHKARNDSFILDAFCGQLRSHVACSRCKTVSKAFDPFMDLSLNIPQNTKGTCHLVECIQRFLEEDTLKGSDSFLCPTCKTQRSAKRRLNIHRFPEVLVFHLKRFAYDRTRRGKISDAVKVPKLGLDLSAIADPQVHPEPVVYNLYAVINHVGGMYGGHYTAECKNPIDGKWYEFNDARVTKISEVQVAGPAAYVLFYRRVP